MRRAFVSALRARGMDVTTAIEEQMIDRADQEHLNYATQQGRVLFSFNRGDFYRLHTQYMMEGRSHAGILLANQQQFSAGEQMRRVLLVAAARSATEMTNRIEFLSSWP